MPNTESVFALIDRCEFAAENPFELKENLFPVLNDIGSTSITKLFEKNCYNSWLVFGFNGESKVSVFYDTILQKLSNGDLNKYYGHLEQHELDKIKNDFKEIIQDEIRHRDIFSAIIDKIDIKPENYNPDYYNPQCQEFVQGENNYWLHGTLFDFLADIVSGESYLLAAFVLFYRYTNNPIKKQIFKEFIQEESKHIAHFMNFMKKAKIDPFEIPSFQYQFQTWASQRSKFESANFESFLDKLVKEKNKKEQIANKSYDTEFHKTFSKMFIKKSLQFYNIVCPEVDQNEYEQFIGYTVNK